MTCLIGKCLANYFHICLRQVDEAEISKNIKVKPDPELVKYWRRKYAEASAAYKLHVGECDRCKGERLCQ